MMKFIAYFLRPDNTQYSRFVDAADKETAEWLANYYNPDIGKLAQIVRAKKGVHY
jgi:hypothetical protein